MKHSKQYCIGVRSSSDCLSLPACIKFEIDESDAKEIIRLSEIVKSNDLYKVERFDWRAAYLRSNPHRAAVDGSSEAASSDECSPEDNAITVDAPTLNVSDDEFWFAASIRDADIEVISDHLPIRELIQTFWPCADHAVSSR